MEVLNPDGVSYSSISEIASLSYHIGQTCWDRTFDPSVSDFDDEFMSLMIAKDCRVFVGTYEIFGMGETAAEILIQYPFADLIAKLVYEACEKLSLQHGSTHVVSLSAIVHLEGE